MANGGKFENDEILRENDEDLREKEEEGKEEEEEEKEKEEKEEEDINAEEIFDVTDEKHSFIAWKPQDGTIIENILEFFYSYAYDCRKYFNLCVVDPNTIAFAAGNLIQFFNVEENKIWFKLGSIGTGIGHISKNPVFEHIAIGANGKNPVINILDWPRMTTIIVLKGGTTKRYLHLSYSPDGLLLASQGGEPDYYISLWNWKESKIVLQCKSYVQNIYNVTFSKFIPGQLTSSGIGHIKFWKMSKTFTGLKLKGEIGKFGSTEISDIIAIYPMPNETVISGCEWGNILLWDESLIKLEACRKNKEAAHTGFITQFEFINQELISVGSDGWIRFWFYETIDHADLADDEQFLEIQPIYEFEIAENEENAMLISIQKQEPDNLDKTIWYAQEAVLLIGCLKGDCVEVKLPIIPQSYTTTSYELIKCKPVSFKFESVKSMIEREAIRKKYEEEREERLKERRKKMEELIAESPHIVIDEETFLMEVDEKEMILPEIYIPEIPNKVLIAQYGINGNIWLFMAGFDAGYVYEYPRPLSAKPKDIKLIRPKIIEYAKDIEMHNFLFQKNKKYLYLGTQYGQIYVIKIKEEDPLNFLDCWILQTHDHYNGHISKILLSYNKEMLLTCGHDGNIFSFSINDISDEKYEIPKLEYFLFVPKIVEDIEDVDYPTLEEVITRIEQNRIISVAEEKKKNILEIVRNLAEEFTKITTRNKSLLKSQQILQFDLDPRIVEDLEQQLKTQIILTQQKLEFEVEKNKLQLEKLMNHFIMPITCLPFAVYGILNENKAVYSVRELKLDTDGILKCMKLMKQEERQKTDRIIKEQIEEEKREVEEREIQYVELLGEDFRDLTSGLGLQINQMFSKYKEKKIRLMERQKEWQKLYRKKPNLIKGRLKDTVFLEKAKQTIGEYNLKVDVDFSLTRKRETAAIKFKQLMDCRNKLHNLRENFNMKLKTIALKKQRMQEEFGKLIETLKKIHIEIPLKNVKPLPYPPKVNLDIEFPEHNLELEKYISMSEKMQQVKREKQSLIVDQLIDYSDLEYEVLYCDDKNNHEEQDLLHSLISSSTIKIRDQSSIAYDLIKNLNVNDSVQTSWEREMKRSRMWRKIYQQDCILQHINTEYKQLENELDELEKYRLNVIYQSIYMNLNLLTLYEEFIILRESETMEHLLEEKVTQKSNEHTTLVSKMQGTNINITTREEEIRKLYTKIKDIATEFAKTTVDSKFHNFLQKIFKKKYTIKKANASLDSVTESTETTDEETDDDIDSEAEYVPFDENICPVGCDIQLYEMAFAMREKRYAYEFQIREEQKEIELLQKELDTDTKYLKIVESILKSHQEELEKFMLDKQKKLNEINVTVILKLHQLQHILDSGSIANIEDCIVFNKKKLSNLYARVGELQEETYNLEETRKKNEIHLKRIKLDLKYMKAQNKKLKEEIKEKMIQKFGCKVSLIELYEIILQRLIYDTKIDVRKIMKNFTKDIENTKWKYKESLITLENLIQYNTEKLSFLTILEKENFKLKKILKQTLISEKDMLEIELEHKTDLITLENILHNQIQQKHILQNDIENLKIGSRKLFSNCLNQNIS
ncbi:cilia- and flagella-associated protein 44 isoform X2 [Apis dorsata]|uniref:cilia- and flagella-associated protein 44 isoform X2 n=1 Tax=Apis dorsata TaxID=7462 RepID=UPI001293AE9E|nr:cilia- and flagella-associated protein 44 isoform X2 [Apis dorsata]